MNNGSGAAAYELYPLDYFHRAPTYKKWVKLTAADVRLLRQEVDFDGQNIYFLLNHPIEFVYLIGTVVAIDHVSTKYGTYFTTFELDDGSGSVIEVKIAYKRKDVNRQVQDSQETSWKEGTTAEGVEVSDDELGFKEDSSSNSPASLRTEVSETEVRDLIITSSPRFGWTVTLQDEMIEVGTVLKVKGTLSRFREAFQLVLKRAFIVAIIDEELAFWEDYAYYCSTTLSKPWKLSERALAAVREELREERRHTKRVEERKKEYEAKKERSNVKARARNSKIDAVREAEAREMDGNALDKPDWKPHKAKSLAGLGKPAINIEKAAKSPESRLRQPSPQVFEQADEAASLPQVLGSVSTASQQSTEQHDRDGFRIPAMPLNRGFVRAASHPSIDHASMPWHHAKSDSKPVGELAVAGPSLGRYRTSQLMTAIFGDESTVWKHGRTHNPLYKKPVRRSSNDANESISDTS